MKYLLAYSIPIVSLLGIYEQEILSYAGVLFAFGLIPIMELLLPVDISNYSEEKINGLATDFAFFFKLKDVFGIISNGNNLKNDSGKITFGYSF